MVEKEQTSILTMIVSAAFPSILIVFLLYATVSSQTLEDAFERRELSLDLELDETDEVTFSTPSLLISCP